MRNGLPGLPFGLLPLLLAPCCGGCGANRDADPGLILAGRLDLLGLAGAVAVEGDLRAGRDAWLTRWYGRESEAGAPALLGDERPAWIVGVPSRIRCPLPACDGPRRLTVAARRVRAGTVAALRAEVFWQEAGGAPGSAAAVEIHAGEDRWQELAADLPATAGDLWLVARPSHSGLAESGGAQFAWGAPVVAPIAAPDLPDVILIAVDTLRADAMPKLPSVAGRLAAGEWAPQALAPSNWTLPSFASLWTGLPADAHGAGRGAFAPAPVSGPEDRGYTELGAARSFAEALREAGWATACVHQNPFLEPWTGLSRGFERWVRTADAPELNRAPAEAWWRAQAHRPRLLVLHWMTPHLPYGEEDAADPMRALSWREFLAGDHEPDARRAFFDLPEPARAEVRRRYYEEVAALDRALAAWLPELLATARRPALLFFSDHGEELWDAGSFEHGHSFDASVVRVPAGFLWPGADRPARLHGPAPAGDLGLHLLHRLAESDPAITRALASTARGLPACGFAPGCPGRAGRAAPGSLRPLYRAEADGVRVGPDGELQLLPFSGAGSGGAAPRLDAETWRRLQELGYAAPGD